MSNPSIAVGNIVIDCPDPRTLARFYSELLGRPIAPDGDDGWVDLEGQPLLSFQRVPDYDAPVWPDGLPQQFHLDLDVEPSEMAASHARAVELGATPLDPVDPPRPDDTRTFRVYADPAGHPFCLCAC